MLFAMKPIDGKTIALDIRTKLKDRITHLSYTPKLGVILVGEDAPSHIYVNLKEKAAKEAGITTDVRRFPAEVTDTDLIKIIEEWNADPEMDAILVQIPLPPGHDTDAIIHAMDPAKDVDGFHPTNVTALENGEPNVIPPVHEAILRLIAATDVAPDRNEIVVIANSDTFATPLVQLLKTAGGFVQRSTPDDLDTSALRHAKIIISAAGRAGLINGADLSPGVCLIDVGTNRLPDGKVVGDVDVTSTRDVDGWITPVPGGVGPMTIAMLLKNVVDLAEKRRK